MSVVYKFVHLHAFPFGPDSIYSHGNCVVQEGVRTSAFLHACMLGLHFREAGQMIQIVRVRSIWAQLTSTS